jgi:hypothetical protein
MRCDASDFDLCVLMCGWLCVDVDVRRSAAMVRGDSHAAEEGNLGTFGGGEEGVVCCDESLTLMTNGCVARRMARWI